MITWLTYWPVLLTPTVILSALAALPTRMFNGYLVGGGPVREYYLNHFILPVLPADAARSLVAWFSTASGLQEWHELSLMKNHNEIVVGSLLLTSSFSVHRQSTHIRGATKSK
jgi:hypothetical protein